jgi:hypothetical protein
MRIVLIALLVFGLSLPSAVLADEAKLPDWVAKAKWQPPPEGVVRDAASAISLARTVWVSMTGKGGWVSMIGEDGSETTWQKEMAATLVGGVWQVTCKSPPTGPGGCLFIYIAQSDARVLSVVVTE